MKKLAFVFIIAISLSACKCGSDCEHKNCDDFATQKDAQKAFDNNKDCYKNLDRDGDGVPCESLPKE